MSSTSLGPQSVFDDLDDRIGNDPASAVLYVTRMLRPENQPGRRLRMLGYLISANKNLGRRDAVEKAISEGLAIIESAEKTGTTGRSGLSRLDRAEFFYRQVDYYSNIESWIEVAQCLNEGLAMTELPEKPPTSPWGRTQHRRRCYLRALLLFYYAELASHRCRPIHAIKILEEAFFLIPKSHRQTRKIKRKAYDRSRLSMISLLVNVLTTHSKTLPSDMTVLESLLVDNPELPAIGRAQLAKGRAVIALRRRQPEEAAQALVEALDALYQAKAWKSYEETLEELAKIEPCRAREWKVKAVFF